MDSEKIEISVIAPMFNEEQNVEKTFSRLNAMISGLHKNNEIIFVNDGSTDGTLRVREKVSMLLRDKEVVEIQESI